MSASAGAADVVLDCRWLPLWGAGRVSELLLRGLAEDPPPGSWTLWGPATVEAFAWPGARVARDDRDPRAAWAQRAWFDVPPGRLTVFLHQQRPLRRLPSVTLFHDTIQLRWGGTPLERRLRGVFLRRSAAVSDGIITISDYSRRSVLGDLDVPPQKVSVVGLPLDTLAADRLLERRRRHGRSGQAAAPYALFLGRFAPHKNLDRLLAAFAETEFRRTGGRLVLAGGTPEEVGSVAAALPADLRDAVDLRARTDDPGALDDLLAGALFVVQPSLEEGFGLPVVEALGAGVPVCVSDGGALPELVAGVDGVAPPFPARSAPDMAAALDRVAAEAVEGGRDYEERLAASARLRFATVPEYARRFRSVVEQSLAAV